MICFVLMLCLAPAQAQSDPWGQVPWGGALPAGAEAEHDPPWAAAQDRTCGWVGELLLCAGSDGVDAAYRQHASPVLGGSTRWLQTAGLEWSRGNWSPTQAPPGYQGAVWGSPLPPYGGWELRRQESAAAPSASPPTAGLMVRGELSPQERRALADRMIGCDPRGLDQMPVVVLYDPQGRARMVRFQGLPLEQGDWGCAARALGTLSPRGPSPFRELTLVTVPLQRLPTP